MKRKALSCILALTMCVALLVSGCGNTKSDKNDDGKKSSKKDEIHSHFCESAIAGSAIGKF